MTENTIETHNSSEPTPVRHNKFPLTLHPTGQYCKKIQGKMYYLGRGLPHESLDLHPHFGLSLWRKGGANL